MKLDSHESHIKKVLQGYEHPVDTDVLWKQVRPHVKKRRRMLWWPWLFLLVVVIATGGWWWSNDHNLSINPNHVRTDDSQASITPDSGSMFNSVAYPLESVTDKGDQGQNTASDQQDSSGQTDDLLPNRSVNSTTISSSAKVNISTLSNEISTSASESTQIQNKPAASLTSSFIQAPLPARSDQTAANEAKEVHNGQEQTSFTQELMAGREAISVSPIERWSLQSLDYAEQNIQVNKQEPLVVGISKSKEGRWSIGVTAGYDQISIDNNHLSIDEGEVDLYSSRINSSIRGDGNALSLWINRSWPSGLFVTGNFGYGQSKLYQHLIVEPSTVNIIPEASNIITIGSDFSGFSIEERQRISQSLYNEEAFGLAMSNMEFQIMLGYELIRWKRLSIGLSGGMHTRYSALDYRFVGEQEEFKLYESEPQRSLSFGYVVSPHLEWRLADHWSLKGSFQYIHQPSYYISPEYNDRLNAHQWRVTAGIFYQW